MQPSTNPRTRGETTIPANLQQLVEQQGVTKAAKRLGISTTTIHKARTSGVVSKVVEIAAAGILKYAKTPEGKGPEGKVVVQEMPNLNPNLDTALYLIEVPENKAPLVEMFAERLGAHVLRA